MFDNLPPIRIAGPFGPDTPPVRTSDLFRLAARDIRRMPDHIELNMSTYASEVDNELCGVCAAGAVAMGELDCVNERQILLVVNGFGPWGDKLRQIDSARYGRIYLEPITPFSGIEPWFCIPDIEFMGRQRREIVAFYYACLAQALDDTVYRHGDTPQTDDEAQEDFVTRFFRYHYGHEPLVETTLLALA